MIMKNFNLIHEFPGISSSYPSHGSSYLTTDDSESDQCSSTSKSRRKCTNVFWETKTSRYNRPPHDKKLLDQRDKIAMRHSSRIQQLLEEKKKLDEVRLYSFQNEYLFKIYFIMNIHNKYSF